MCLLNTHSINLSHQCRCIISRRHSILEMQKPQQNVAVSRSATKATEGILIILSPCIEKVNNTKPPLVGAVLEYFIRRIGQRLNYN